MLGIGKGGSENEMKRSGPRQLLHVTKPAGKRRFTISGWGGVWSGSGSECFWGFDFESALEDLREELVTILPSTLFTDYGRY